MHPSHSIAMDDPWLGSEPHPLRQHRPNGHSNHLSCQQVTPGPFWMASIVRPGTWRPNPLRQLDNKPPHRSRHCSTHPLAPGPEGQRIPLFRLHLLPFVAQPLPSKCCIDLFALSFDDGTNTIQPFVFSGSKLSRPAYKKLSHGFASGEVHIVRIRQPLHNELTVDGDFGPCMPHFLATTQDARESKSTPRHERRPLFHGVDSFFGKPLRSRAFEVEVTTLV